MKISSSSAAWAALVAVIVIVGSAGAYAIQSSRDDEARNRALTVCITNWANRTTHRTSVLTAANNARQDAFDQLIRSIPLNNKHPIRARRQFLAAFHHYISESNAYKLAVQLYPVPKSPKFTCRKAQ